jgi:hydroxymethylglutaryl-CoA reductase
MHFMGNSLAFSYLYVSLTKTFIPILPYPKWVVHVNSEISGFYKLTPEERLKKVAELASLSSEEAGTLRNFGAIGEALADRMVENVIGSMQLPLGIAVNFTINGKDYLIPMAIEEPSVVAAASNAAKMARKSGGFRASSTPPVMISQIQITGVKNPDDAVRNILAQKQKIIGMANEKDPMLVKAGGGARDIEVRKVESAIGTFIVVHLLVDCRDAMGANAVNTMAETLAPFMEELTGGEVYLRILSNLAVYRLARAEVTYAPDDIGGPGVVDGVVTAYEFAAADPFRCATHNKGVMNGIDSVIIATGNDFRAIEAGAHAYVSYKGAYKPMTRWWKDERGHLHGSIEVPMAVGLIGGATAVHPIAKIAVKILGVKSANELGEIAATVGLAQNFAALRALATEGIQKGHMRLHARNIAISAGATPEEADAVVNVLVKEKQVRMDRAKEVLEKMRDGK